MQIHITFQNTKHSIKTQGTEMNSTAVGRLLKKGGNA